MKLLTLLTLLVFTMSIQAMTITKRYPHRSATRDQACNNAKQHVESKARDQCSNGVQGYVSTSCNRCDVKKGFGVEQWACNGVAEYSCKGNSRSNSNNSSYSDRAIRSMRGTLRKNTSGGQSPCLQSPNSSKCREWKNMYKRAGGVRN